jgi:RNA polymerase sigma factor (sigma-70 family)
MPPKHPGEDESDALSDGDLLRGSSSDPQLFGLFYDRHVTAILSYFMSRTACAHTAGDLTAETFAKALSGSHRFDESRGPARGWLFGIARHELAYSLRKEKVRDRALRRLGMRRPDLDQESLERIDALLDSQKHAASLKAALTTLPPAIMQAVVLRVGHDLPFVEVARQLNCSEGAARVRVSRGLAALHEALAVTA